MKKVTPLDILGYGIATWIGVDILVSAVDKIRYALALGKVRKAQAKKIVNRLETEDVVLVDETETEDEE